MPAEVKGKPKSRYALKREGKLVKGPSNRPRRRCDECGGRLAGRRGHGFIAASGRKVVCGLCRAANAWLRA